jgi:hypothetical protein
MRVSSVKSCYRPGPTRHRFPNPRKYAQRFDEWLKRTGNSELLMLDPWKVYNHHMICCLYFKSKEFAANNKLTKEAIPNLKIPHDKVILKIKHCTACTYFRTCITGPDGQRLWLRFHSAVRFWDQPRVRRIDWMAKIKGATFSIAPGRGRALYPRVRVGDHLYRSRERHADFRR